MYNSTQRSRISGVRGEYPGTEEGTIMRMEDGGPEELGTGGGGGGKFACMSHLSRIVSVALRCVA